MLIAIRIDGMTLNEVQSALDNANLTRKAEPYNRSTWIRDAIREKLDHLRRAKRARRSNKNVQGDLPKVSASEACANADGRAQEPMEGHPAFTWLV